MSRLRVLCLGDIVGRPGREALKRMCAALREQCRFDLFIVNGENSAGGMGISSEIARELRSCGVDVITTGDHVWKQRDSAALLNKEADSCIRPANYPEGVPGRGWTVIIKDQLRIGVFNLLGRVFTNNLVDCPFRKADEVLNGPLKDCQLRICDFHAEATSEKVALARYLDGRVSLLFGTHTHVPTADAQILPGGAGYVTDLGMCGSTEGVIGMETQVSLTRFLQGMPSSYKVAQGRTRLCGVLCEIDKLSGKALHIESVQVDAGESN